MEERNKERLIVHHIIESEWQDIKIPNFKYYLF